MCMPNYCSRRNNDAVRLARNIGNRIGKIRTGGAKISVTCRTNLVQPTPLRPETKRHGRGRVESHGLPQRLPFLVQTP
jgi:hypothetical protein